MFDGSFGRYHPAPDRKPVGLDLPGILTYSTSAQKTAGLATGRF
jgi:hypothetical protein